MLTVGGPRLDDEKLWRFRGLVYDIASQHHKQGNWFLTRIDWSRSCRSLQAMTNISCLISNPKRRCPETMDLKLIELRHLIYCC